MLAFPLVKRRFGIHTCNLDPWDLEARDGWTTAYKAEGLSIDEIVKRSGANVQVVKDSIRRAEENCEKLRVDCKVFYRSLQEVEERLKAQAKRVKRAGSAGMYRTGSTTCPGAYGLASRQATKLK
ncbi:MAG: hypothetical protein PHV42_00795 [Candidatus Pacebacteria bacterium]|nr:hypothetical protein [Candidatus Paceibacterota bacterium]